MNDFERTYQIEPSREANYKREMHLSIELSDEERIEKPRFIFNQDEFNKEMEEVERAYREIGIILLKSLRANYSTEMHPSIEIFSEESAEKKQFISNQDKFKKEIEDVELEKTINKGKKNAKIKSKSIKGKFKKANTKSNKPAVESIQEKL